MVKPWRRQESIWENKRRNVSLPYWGQKHKVIQVAWIYASSLKMSFASDIFCCSISPPEGYWRGHMFFFFKCRYSCSVNMTMCHGRLDILRVSPVRHSCRGEACEASGRPAELRAVVKGNLASASWGQNSCSPSWRLCPVCFFLPPQPFSQPRLEAAYVPVRKEQVSPLLTSLVVVVRSLGCVWLFAMAWTAASQASLCFTISWNLLRFMSIVSVMLSNHLILCHPLLLLPSIFPSIRIFSNELALRIRWPKDWSFSISPSSKFLLWTNPLKEQGASTMLLRLRRPSRWLNTPICQQRFRNKSKNLELEWSLKP